jgi:uncharacterized protein YggU (UPF0235/DUF167 family)
MRVRIKVRPGAGRTAAGGCHDQSLIIRVQERASDGKATAAALVALAKALNIRKEDVKLISGARSRSKVVDIPDAAALRFSDLRGC